MDDFPWIPRQANNGVTISCQTRPFDTKNIFFDSIKRVSLVLSADGDTIVFWSFWSSCMHKCIPLPDLRFLCKKQGTIEQRWETVKQLNPGPMLWTPFAHIFCEKIVITTYVFPAIFTNDRQFNPKKLANFFCKPVLWYVSWFIHDCTLPYTPTYVVTLAVSHFYNTCPAIAYAKIIFTNVNRLDPTASPMIKDRLQTFIHGCPGAVVIASAWGTEDPGSSQGVCKFLGKNAVV
jgi:hypothetical protein